MPKSRKKIPNTKAEIATVKKRKASRKSSVKTSHEVGANPVVSWPVVDTGSEPSTNVVGRDDRAAVLGRIWSIIESRKDGSLEPSHSARLIEKGTAHVAQKLGEEAIECLIEAIAGNRIALIGESADLLYHLLVVWVDAGIKPEEVWEELERRESVSMLTKKTKRPLKRLLGPASIGTSKIP